jgi:hypothetical protein
MREINRKVLGTQFGLLFCILCFSCSANVPGVSVKSFGAKGNGVSDDTKAIRAAFASIATVGGTIYFPKGVYISDVIDIHPAKNATIMVYGDGPTSLIKFGKDFNNPVSVFFCEVPGVNLTFRDLAVDGNYMNRSRLWKTVGPGLVDIDERLNGIFVYNVNKLTVSRCTVKNVHGEGISCYSANEFTADHNVVSNVSGSGIKGHQVTLMNATYNVISNCGLLTSAFTQDGKPKTFGLNTPFTKFGDGIEAESKVFKASYNKISNSGRCGIVHDLAQDLNYSGSEASVLNNTVTVNSARINSNNPPAGMWFEQTANVTVSNNTVTILRSKSKLTSGIRFYNITGNIVCSNNHILATKYNHNLDNAIGLFEPATTQVNITANVIQGKFKSAIAVSYEKAFAQLVKLNISKNAISGLGKIDNGISLNISGSKNFPDQTDITANTIVGLNLKPYDFFYYGTVQRTSKASVLNFTGNKLDAKFSGYTLKALQGLTIRKK